jgi:type III secretion system needle length determinant
MGTTTSQPNQAPASGPDSQRPALPDAESQALFESLKSGSQAGAGSLGAQGADPKLAGAREQLLAQEQLSAPIEDLSSVISQTLDLRHLSRPETAPLGSGEAQQVQAGSEANSSLELAEKLVARVLVSEKTGLGQEARLMVDPSLLPDTEIRLNRGVDGFLNVTVLTSDPGAMQALVQARSDLERALQKTEGASFKLELSGSQDQDGAHRDNPDRRSRGLDWQF